MLDGSLWMSDQVYTWLVTWLYIILVSTTHLTCCVPQVCVFCRNNGEDEAVYSTHSLKSGDGKVTCPILFAYECPICRATGDNAHTLKYCPKNPNGQGAHQHSNQAPTNNQSNGYQGYSGSNNMGYGNSSSNRASSGNAASNANNLSSASNTSNTGNGQINTNLIQAMLQMSGMNGNVPPALAQLNFNMAAMLYQQQEQQPNNPFAEWLQQQQQQPQPQQQQQPPQQYGGDSKGYSMQQQQQHPSVYNTQQQSNHTPQQQQPGTAAGYYPQHQGTYSTNTSPTYSQNYNSGYAASNANQTAANYTPSNANYTPSNANYTANNSNYTPSNTNYTANNSNYTANNSNYPSSNSSNYTPPAEVYQDSEIENNLTQLFGKASIEDFMQNYSR